VPEYRIRYEGGAAIVGALAQMLREEGVEVTYEPPDEWRSPTIPTVVAAVVVNMIANGAYDAIKAGIRRFRGLFPRSSVEIEDDDADHD
jgi:hypothetical protein